MFGIRKRTWLIGSIVAALVGTAAIASRYNNVSMEDRADFATYMITKRLELNNTQEASLDKLAASLMASASTMSSFRQAMFAQVKTLATGESLSVEQVRAVRDEIKVEFDRRSDQMIPEFVTFYNGLNSDQKAKIVARLDNAAEHMGKRSSRRHWGFGSRRHHGDNDRK